MIIATFPKKLAACKFEELIPIAIGFIVGFNLIRLIGYPDNHLYLSMHSYIEPISIIILLVFLVFYSRRFFSLSAKQNFKMKIIFLGIASIALIYRLISWNLIGGNFSIIGYSLIGGLLISGVLLFILLNQEVIEESTSKNSLIYSSIKLMCIAVVVYALYLSSFSRLSGNYLTTLILIPIEYEIRVLLIRIAALFLYVWIILRSIFNIYSMRRAWLTTSIVIPILWIVFALSAILIVNSQVIFNIPLFSIIIFGIVMIYTEVRSSIQEKRWEIQFKETIEMNQHT
ncbi:MAG: hypothetical protein KKH92_01900 [Firmicutes bacterium]|nr:hypothetical protein [Bacillota bacterium]